MNFVKCFVQTALPIYQIVEVFVYLLFRGLIHIFSIIEIYLDMSFSTFPGSLDSTKVTSMHSLYPCNLR